MNKSLCFTPKLWLQKKGGCTYECSSEEVDVRVSPVIKGCIDGAGYPREALGDGPGVALTLLILCEYLVILSVISPELSTCPA